MIRRETFEPYEEEELEPYEEEELEPYEEEELEEATNVPRRIAPSPVRPPLSPMGRLIPGQGISTVTARTKQGGTATLQLPERVPTASEFNQRVQQLQSKIDDVTRRVNTVEKSLREDIVRVTNRVNQVAKDTDRKLALGIAKLRKEERKEAQSAQMMSMVMTMMIQKNLEAELSTHSHTVASAQTVEGTVLAEHTHAIKLEDVPTGIDQKDSINPVMLMMLLPQFQGESGSSSTSGGDMSQMLLMMALSGMF